MYLFILPYDISFFYAFYIYSYFVSTFSTLHNVHMYTFIIIRNGSIRILSFLFYPKQIIEVFEFEFKAPSVSHSILRSASCRKAEPLLYFYLGFLMAFFVPLKQTLHDKLSNCVVIDV